MNREFHDVILWIVVVPNDDNDSDEEHHQSGVMLVSSWKIGKWAIIELYESLCQLGIARRCETQTCVLGTGDGAHKSREDGKYEPFHSWASTTLMPE